MKAEKSDFTEQCDSGDARIFICYEHGPFGELTRKSGTMAKANPFRSSTKYQDDESDFLYYGYRLLNASTGKWLSRDPAEEEEGGMNLFAFCANNPISQSDNLGLALYAIGGTWETAAEQANPWWMVQETKEFPRRFFPGPDAPGNGSPRIALDVVDQIQEDFCAAKAAGKEFTINLTGWSRGAVIAVQVATILKYSGFWCNESCNLKHYQPVTVNWMGLFDAVSRMPPRTGMKGSVLEK
jgi:RHS repeat-associated protein